MKRDMEVINKFVVSMRESRRTEVNYTEIEPISRQWAEMTGISAEPGPFTLTCQPEEGREYLLLMEEMGLISQSRSGLDYRLTAYGQDYAESLDVKGVWESAKEAALKRGIDLATKIGSDLVIQTARRFAGLE